MSTSSPSSAGATSSAAITSSSSTTKNLQQYHYPPISTLRRASRPGNIDLSIFDHNHSEQSNDPGIYSAPICYLKQTNHPHQHIQQSSHPYTASFQYQPHQQQQLQLLSHHPPPQQTNIQLYQQQQQQQHQHQQQQQQQQQIHDPFSQHQHTPHTFPLQASPSHYHQCFYFPPSTLQGNVTTNGHPTPNSNQPSTPTPNNRLRAVQIQEQQQQWSNPVLSPLMVKRMNENAASMVIDDDEDPSASIDALVADVDSNSQDLLNDPENKSLNEPKTTSITPAGPRTPSPHIYLRGTSHILTTPPNPLASDDHPDNQLKSFQKTFSPISSAGFELATSKNNMNNSSANLPNDRSYFSFDSNLLEQAHLKSVSHHDIEDNNQDKLIQPLLRNPDVRTTKVSSNNLIQDDSSNHSSTNSSSQNASSRILNQMLQASEQRRSTSSSPLSTDVKLSSLDPGNNSTNINALTGQQTNRYLCTHPDCNKAFANKSALAKHKLTHSQDRKHKCSKCSKGFKRLDHLHGHMLTHEEEKPHKCRVPNCNRTYCDARSLKRHIENSHQDILAAIHEGVHDEYRSYLPETAFVKAKDLTINNEISMDSVDSNSPQSLIDNEQSFNIRSATGGKILTTYTFDEEKYVECHICKKNFKSSAALNGHMRLHGGFNEKQATPSVPDNRQKKKRTQTPPKRKRIDSPLAAISIKKEEQDIPMFSSTDNPYHNHHHHHHHHHHHQHQQPLFSDVPQQQTYDRSLPSRSRSASSSVVTTTSPSFPTYITKNPLSVQPPTKQARKQNPLSTHGFEPSRINISNGMIGGDQMSHRQIFSNISPPSQQYDEKIRKSALSSENFVENPQFKLNGVSSPYAYVHLSSQQHPSNHIQFNTTSSPSNSMSTNLLQHLFRQKADLLNQDSYSIPSTLPDNSVRYIPPSHIIQPSISNSTSLLINTPVTSPYSNFNTSHASPSSSAQIYNNSNNNTSAVNHNSMQPSPTTQLISSSSCSATSSPASSVNAPKKRFLNSIKQEKQDDKEQIVAEEEPAVLTIVPDIDSPLKKMPSGFLIGTPSSTGASSSSSSSSSHTHFNYDNILPSSASTAAAASKRESTPSSFQWPSQFRRQLSLNTGKPLLNAIPSTPYTPPPMLSPFRKGPGLYYRVFSQPGTSGEAASIPTTPILPFTPGAEESTGPKINIGREYQAAIPKLRTTSEDENAATVDELLFSPFELTYYDEKSLEKFEQLNRMNPFLFSSRHAPASYPLELVYMLLHEYNGDLQRTLTSLLEGTAKDIKQCRPLHHYRFLECDNWTKEEIDAFTKAIQTSEKNFGLVSREVGTKTVKQCIEFYYMPKVGVGARKLLGTGTSSVITRRKRCQMLKSKQQLEDETSSSPFNDFRQDDDISLMNSDSPITTQYICDISECLQTFTSERAYRAHRKDHRRTNNTLTSLTSIKRSRNIDSTK
ncbi:hypothetical protein I4U23_013844 [Adineta vaga]|nr:hypothetical protein I4U23_013844 [Adineta vaga]